jgi:hypothetical protein
VGFKPVIILNVKKFLAQKASLEELQLVGNYLFNWVIENMLVPGHIESWVVVIDFKDVGIT